MENKNDPGYDEYVGIRLEIENFPPTMNELMENFRNLFRKLNRIQPLWSTSLKKDALLCIVHINAKIKYCERNTSYEDCYAFEQFLLSPLHVASKGGFHNLIKVVLFKNPCL